MKKFLAALSLMIATAAGAAGQNVTFMDRSMPDRFVDISAHVMVGGSYVTNDYMSCFPQITDLNTSMRPAVGFGARVKFLLRNYLSLGTELSYIFNSNRMDMAITGDNTTTSISNVFMRNRYRYINIPVFVTLNFNLATSVVWNVDAGFYYAYGTGGSQRSTIYDARVNNLGQLMTSIDNVKADYFNDDDAFINSYHRSDVGLHIGTGLTFSRRISVGITAQYGLKNIANTVGILHPECHNFNFFARVGYHF